MCSDICLMRIWDYIEPELKHGELKIMYNVTLRKKNKNQGKNIFSCRKILTRDHTNSFEQIY